MPHYRSMYDADFIGAWDLPNGRDVVVTIERVEAAKVKGAEGKESKRPVLSFAGAKKKMVCNKTNGKAIAGMYGPETSKWVGKKIALYAGTTKAFGETVECVRVRPSIPKGKGDEPPPAEFSEPTAPPERDDVAEDSPV